MLYDPKWEVQQKAKPSVAGFMAWLKAQDPEKKYDFENQCGECLFGQYMAACGVEWSWPMGYAHFIVGLFGNLWPSQDIAAEGQWTFGAALQRAQAMFRDVN